MNKTAYSTPEYRILARLARPYVYYSEDGPKLRDKYGIGPDEQKIVHSI